MATDDLGGYNIKRSKIDKLEKWKPQNSTSQGTPYDIPTQTLTQSEPKSNTNLFNSKEYHLPKNPVSSTSVGKRANDELPSRVEKSIPTQQPQSSRSLIKERTVITNDNPLGQTAETVKVKPPLFAEAGKIKVPSKRLFTPESSPKPKPMPNGQIPKSKAGELTKIRPTIPPSSNARPSYPPNANIKAPILNQQKAQISIQKSPTLSYNTSKPQKIGINISNLFKTSKNNVESSTTQIPQSQTWTQQGQSTAVAAPSPQPATSTHKAPSEGKKPAFQLTSTVIGVLAAVLIISLLVGVIYLVLTNANTAVQTITLSASPSGGIPPYTYQWYSNGGCGIIISGQTGQTLSLTNAGSNTYSVQITDSVSDTSCINYSI